MINNTCEGGGILGKSRPTLPIYALQSVQGCIWVDGDSSVIPYACFTGILVRLYRASTRSLVKGAAPEFNILNDDRSYLATLGCLARRRIMGGTT